MYVHDVSPQFTGEFTVCYGLVMGYPAFKGCNMAIHTADGRNPAPCKKLWDDDSPANTNKQWFQPWFQSGAGFRPFTVPRGSKYFMRMAFGG